MLNTTLINRKQALKVVKELDAFPKVPDGYQETSATGGGLSIVTFILIGLLIISEVSYYTDTEMKFEYVVDSNYSGKVKLNIDMTVAMKCHHVGADVLDQTGQDVLGFGHLQEEPVFWELSEDQQNYQRFVQEINDYFSKEYHAIQEILWKGNGIPTFSNSIPKSGLRQGPDHPGQHDACRIHGSLEVNKVAGNFHITAGKSVPVIPRGHAHLAMMMDTQDYNFSHRIDHFSFGSPVNGIIFPLDGSEITTSYNYHSFQYFMQVVPTEVRTYKANMDTYQFAVTDNNRPINHNEGSHGVPGIFVKYDLSPLLIRVKEVHRPLWLFLVELCGIIGGIFSASGIINGIVGFIADIVCCRLNWGQKKSGITDNQQSVSSASTLIGPNFDSNLLNDSSLFNSLSKIDNVH
ncbi:endoplasmic reticulum-Golgi intermediate compartment protein 2-like [Physella acuta]|uniref:endoplasmic reticulum-Golgi intermediate compartment protein 2-like n=1 Tax=Physella acuta TaxID=109671 RepID=UPI0027DDE738|nr:endoplasmic reticulum-Golgi intermediate compartment protein 2-like [Physella acuta]